MSATFSLKTHSYIPAKLGKEHNDRFEDGQLVKDQYQSESFSPFVTGKSVSLSDISINSARRKSLHILRNCLYSCVRKLHSNPDTNTRQDHVCSPFDGCSIQADSAEKSGAN